MIRGKRHSYDVLPGDLRIIINKKGHGNELYMVVNDYQDKYARSVRVVFLGKHRRTTMVVDKRMLLFCQHDKLIKRLK